MFEGYINPLAFLAAEESRPGAASEKIDCEDVLRYLCQPEVTIDLDGLVSRYREISRECCRLPIVPAEKGVLDKLIWPLKNAIGCYIVGNYLGTISLCGVVAEMVAILKFEISELILNGERVDEKKQAALFGRSYEKLGQEQRVSILHVCGLIDGAMKRHFDTVRTKRRQYLHLYSTDHTQLSRDAVDVFCATVEIVVSALGIGTRGGKVVLDPALLKYLERKGLVRPDNAGPSTET